MKRKTILLTSLAGLSILSIVGATTLAANTTNNVNNQSQINKMMGGRQMNKGSMPMIKNISQTDREKIQNLSTTDRQAMIQATQKAIEAKDYNAFQTAHSKYGITLNITQEQFNQMITKKTDMESQRATKELEKTKIQEAIKNGDFDTRKKLNADKPILNYIDTQAKFTKLQEIQSYREKIQNIAQELGLPQGKGMGEGMGMSKGKGMGMGFGQNK